MNHQHPRCGGAPDAWPGTYFGVDNPKQARREDHGDERRGEEHLDDRNVTGCAILGERCLEDERKGVGRVDAEAVGRCCMPCQVVFKWRGMSGHLPTAKKLWS